MIQLKHGRLPLPAQWLLLAALSAALAFLLHWAGIPAAFFLGPMAAGAVAGTNGAAVRVPPLLFTAAQAILGVFIASRITPEILRSFLHDWPVYLAAVFPVLAAAGALG